LKSQFHKSLSKFKKIPKIKRKACYLRGTLGNAHKLMDEFCLRPSQGSCTICFITYALMFLSLCRWMKLSVLEI